MVAVKALDFIVCNSNSFSLAKATGEIRQSRYDKTAVLTAFLLYLQLLLPVRDRQEEIEDG